MTYRADMAPFTGLGDFVPALRREPRNFHFRAIASTATLAYGRASDWGRRAPPLQPVFQDYSSSRASENCSARSGGAGTSLAKARRRSSSRAAKSAAAPDARLSPFFDGAVGGGNTFSDGFGATCHAPRAGHDGALSQARGLLVDVLYRLDLIGLAGFDLGGLGLLELLGFLDLLALGAIHRRLFGGRLDHAGDPAAQCQGERQCTKSHTCIIAYLRRTTNTSLGNSLPSSGCRTSWRRARCSPPRLRGRGSPRGRRSQSRPPGRRCAPRCRCGIPAAARRRFRKSPSAGTCRESPRPSGCDAARPARSWRQ